jgi:phospholipid-binding lipoprotein MlaA
MTKRWATNLLLAMLLSEVVGCATTNGSDPRDPLEGFNRAMYSFNDGFDEAIGKPVSTAYRDVLPGPARMMIRNFFSNIADLWIGANNLLQAKPLDALTDWTRFAMNSTFGVFGLLDFASEVGIEKHDEDFGQTMGRWGMDEGAYIVWPFLGSSTVRDSVGLTLDIYTDPVLNHRPKGVRGFLVVTRATSKRADLLDASRILEEAALDKYVFQRDAHLQRRRSLVYDGNPPRAEREVPRAEADEPPPSVQPVSDPAAMEAAVRLLEQPASPAASTGG